MMATLVFSKNNSEVYSEKVDLGIAPGRGLGIGAANSLFNWAAKNHDGDAPAVDFDHVEAPGTSLKYNSKSGFMKALGINGRVIQSMIKREYGLDI
jgi:hypothetical protein